MPGSQYVALSGMRTRLDELDRLASDIANISTPGYKSQRGAQKSVDRPSFGDELQTAIDTVQNGTKTDFSAGTTINTGRNLDAAIEGDGFFVIETPHGTRYTRDGHFSKTAAGELVTRDGSVVQGTDGPITIGHGEVHIDTNGVVWNGKTKAGTLSVVRFDNPGVLQREAGAVFRNDSGVDPTDVDTPVVHGETLEGSNVSLPMAMAQLIQVSRNFDTLQRSITTIMNDIDGKTIESLGRRG
jgi:flagellar basal-body rod protein FlgF